MSSIRCVRRDKLNHFGSPVISHHPIGGPALERKPENEPRIHLRSSRIRNRGTLRVNQPGVATAFWWVLSDDKGTERYRERRASYRASLTRTNQRSGVDRSRRQWRSRMLPCERLSAFAALRTRLFSCNPLHPPVFHLIPIRIGLIPRVLHAKNVPTYNCDLRGYGTFHITSHRPATTGQKVLVIWNTACCRTSETSDLDTCRYRLVDTLRIDVFVPSVALLSSVPKPLQRPEVTYLSLLLSPHTTCAARPYYLEPSPRTIQSVYRTHRQAN